LATTPVFLFPYPGAGDEPNVPVDIKDAVERVEAVLNVGTVGVQHTDSGTVTSTTFTADRTGTSNEAGIAFVAPNSGKVIVHIKAGLFNSNATPYNVASYEVRTGAVVGSGTVVVAADTGRGLQTYGTTETRFGATFLVTGLTAGSSYNAQLMYLTQTNTMTVDRPGIIVEPCLA